MLEAAVQNTTSPKDASKSIQHEMFLEKIPFGIQENDLEGRITFSNSAHHRILGYPAKTLIGKHIWDLLPSEEERNDLRKYLSHLVTEQPLPSPYYAHNLRPDGTAVNIQVDWNYKRDKAGNLVGFISAITDVSEKIKLEHDQLFHMEILQNLAEGVCLFRADNGDVIYTNPKFDSMFGYNAGELIGQPIHVLRVSSEKKADDIANDIFSGLEQYGVWSGEVLNRRKDDTPFWSNTTVSSFEHHEYGSVWISIHEDITDKKIAEETRRRSEQKYRDLFENSRDAILIIEDDMFVECNQATLDMLGYQNKQEFLQQHPSRLSPPTQPDGRDSEEKADEMMQIALEKGSNRFEWDHVRANGEVFPVEVLLTPLTTEMGTQVIHTVWRDITIQKQQRERIAHQAHYDSLTQLPNRFLSLDRLEQALLSGKRDNQKVAVFFLDLDNFKTVNDTLGHDWGDKILIESAKRLQNTIRQGDTVGRLGGDEFIILLSGLHNAQEASPVASALLEAFRKPFHIDGRELVLTTSIGIACYPDDGADSNDLLRRADTAMYYSKSQGRNSVHFFTEEMNRDVSRRLQLEEQLHGALTRGEFSLHYQPIIQLKGQQVIGAEALLRWQNQELGNVPPDEFITITEQTGHIIQIGEFIMQEAFYKLAHWQNALHADFKIAINISPRQFRDPGLIDKINSHIKEAKIDSKFVELEITEGVLMSGFANIKSALAELNESGINLAMDDFGTGYSSMSYLRNYPFDVLKIDRSFINDIIDDKADRELVNAIIALAHSLGLKVVAEGVETQEQAQYLEEQGCDFAQGYYFSKPITPQAFFEYAKTHTHN